MTSPWWSTLWRALVLHWDTRVQVQAQGLPQAPSFFDIAEAARMGNVQAMRSVVDGSVKAWALEQAARLTTKTVIDRLPWWSPVHPGTMAYFLQQRWWTQSHVLVHTKLRRYDMLCEFFGGEAGPTRTTMTKQEMAQWCVQYMDLDLAADARANIIGHALTFMGTQEWMSMVLPALDTRLGEV